MFHKNALARRLALAACAIGAGASSPAKVVYVNASAAGSVRDGTSWQTAFRSLNAAWTSISPGDEVWAAAGVYPGGVLIANGATYLGGFAGTEASRDQRDPRRNATIVGDALSESAFVADGSVRQMATVDGFTITGGQGRYIGGTYIAGGIRAEGAVLTVSGNVITGNDIDHKNNASYGGGIYCSQGRVIVHNNVILGNWAMNGAAVFSSGSALTVTSNVIRGNRGSRQYTSRGCGICVYPGEQPVVIADNLIEGNELAGMGAGIYCSATGAVIAGNAIVGNVATWPGAAIHALGQGTIANNIVAMNSDGIAINQGAFTLSHNDVYGNAGPDYPDVADPTGTNGNLRADPLFIEPALHNYRLRAGSPCRDAGDDALVTAGETDLGGRSRISGAHVDIGAYEYDAAGRAPFVLADVVKALRIAGGIVAAQPGDPVSGRIGVPDAARIIRAVAGLDP